MIGCEKTSAEAEETIRRAEIMMQAVYNEDGTCMNMEVRLKAIMDPDRWDRSQQPGWNWNDYEYRVAQEKPKVPEPIPMDFDDMVDRLKQRKDMHVVQVSTGDIHNVEKLLNHQRAGHSTVIIGGSMPVSYATLANDFTWLDTGLPCVKPTE
jgi:hypothetical protein